MPELPEVEALRCQLENYCLECQITEVTIHEVGNGPRHGLIDDLVLQDSGGIENLLMGNKILEVQRKGKYLWVLLSHENFQDRPYFVVFHFGMTGSFVFRGRELPVYQSFQISSTWPPKFTKLLIKFKNGEEVAFCDPRRLGRIKVFQNEVALESDILAPLAKDCLTDIITGEYIFSQVQKSGCPIKTLLLDQQKVCCGIGNWVADEILYHSRIHPGTKSNQLSQIQCNHLSEAITMVITTACGVHANSALFPSDWIFHHRWEKRSSGKSSTERRLQGHIVRYETINGRTSAYIPELQRLESSRGEKVRRSLSSGSENPSKRSKRTPAERIM